MRDWVIDVKPGSDPYEDPFEARALAKKERVIKNKLSHIRNLVRRWLFVLASSASPRDCWWVSQMPGVCGLMRCLLLLLWCVVALLRCCVVLRCDDTGTCCQGRTVCRYPSSVGHGGTPCSCGHEEDQSPRRTRQIVASGACTCCVWVCGRHACLCVA